MTIRHKGKSWEVFLRDDGTLDTVITVNGMEVRYDGEYASAYRAKDGSMTAKGLRTLAIEAIEDDAVSAI